MTAMVCNFCHKKYEREAAVVELFGSRFCLHDDKLKDYRAINGLGAKNDSIKNVHVVKDGRNKTEQGYINEARKHGDSVVRGSDGLLRRVGASQSKEE